MKIIKITAMWCPSCLITNGIIDEVIKEKNIEVISYDFDIDQIEVEKYDVGTILPVLILVDDNNNEIRRIKGEHTKKELIEFIEG
ncbi:MAG: thioredoxin family protein [Bacilli bacterium]|nr:thioredoxin family protein [Bacilli bacterium]